jgi:hypothetical protein
LITIITDDLGNPKVIYPTDKVEYGREVHQLGNETIIQRRYTFPIEVCPVTVKVDINTNELLSFDGTNYINTGIFAIQL